MAPESVQFYTCCNQLVEACNTCHIVWTKMEHFLVESMCSFVEHCVIRHISTRQHVLARRGLCWSPGDLKTFGGRGDWLKLELDSTNRGIFLLHLLTKYSNMTCYIMPSEICPRTTSNMPCAVCLIGFATHPHAARYIGPIGLGFWGTVGLLTSCLIAFSFRWFFSRMALVGGLWLWHLTLSAPQTLSWTAE